MLSMKPLDYKNFEGLNGDLRERSIEEKKQIENDIRNIINKSIGLSNNTIIFRLYSYIKKDFVKNNGKDIPFEYDYPLINQMIWNTIESITKQKNELWDDLKDVMFFFNLKLEEQKLIFSYYLFNQGLSNFENISERFIILKNQTCFATNVELLENLYKKVLSENDFTKLTTKNKIH